MVILKKMQCLGDLIIWFVALVVKNSLKIQQNWNFILETIMKKQGIQLRMLHQIKTRVKL